MVGQFGLLLVLWVLLFGGAGWSGFFVYFEFAVMIVVWASFGGLGFVGCWIAVGLAVCVFWLWWWFDCYSMVACVSFVDCGCDSGALVCVGVILLVYFGYVCLCCSACLDLVLLVFGVCWYCWLFGVDLNYCRC